MANLIDSPARAVGYPTYFPNSAYDLAVIAASAGGIPAVSDILGNLPADFPAPIVVVQHISPTYRSQLAGLLQFRTRLLVKFAEDGERLRAGTVYFAPPDHHVAITAAPRLALRQTPPVNYCRPAADPLFETASQVFRDRVLGVVLTGTGQDGSSGALAVRRGGGTVVVQDPVTAHARGMPEAAIKAGAADIVLPLKSIPRALVALTMVHGTAELIGLPRAAA